MQKLHFSFLSVLRRTSEPLLRSDKAATIPKRIAGLLSVPNVTAEEITQREREPSPPITVYSKQ